MGLGPVLMLLGYKQKCAVPCLYALENGFAYISNGRAFDYSSDILAVIQV